MGATHNKASKMQIFGFSFNNASTNAVFIALSTYFLIYCTEIYHLSPVTVGLIMTGTRLFDAVTDPIIGLWIDKTNTRFGRFRPWILGGALLSAFNFVLMFSGIKTESTWINIMIIVALYSVFVIGYTMQTACTKSGQNILTGDNKQRTILNSFGMIWTIVVYAIIMGTILPIVNAGGGNQSVTGWRNSALLIGAIQLIFAAFVILALRKKDVAENYLRYANTSQPKFRDFIGIFAHNKALQMLILAASTNKIAQTLQGGMVVVFYVYVVKNQSMQGTVPLITMLLSIIFMFMSVRLISKFGRVEVFKWSSVGGFIFGFAMIPLIALNPSNFMWLVIILSVNALLIAGTTDQNLISMIADAADYEYYMNGRFIPGMIGTAFSFIDKVISSLSSALSGMILAAAGFVSVSETPLSEKMFWTVLITYCAMPAVGHLFSIIGMHFHPLKKSVHEKMLRELEERVPA